MCVYARAQRAKDISCTCNSKAVIEEKSLNRRVVTLLSNELNIIEIIAIHIQSSDTDIIGVIYTLVLNYELYVMSNQTHVSDFIKFVVYSLYAL